MKTIKILLTTVLIISAGFLSVEAAAQEKSKEEQERELRMQEEFEAQKKALADKKKAQEEVQKLMEIRQGDFEKAMRDAKERLDSFSIPRDVMRVYRTPGDRQFYIGDPGAINPGNDMIFNWVHAGDAQRTTWDFSKSVKENSFSRSYSFDVDPDSKNVVMSVNGDCKAGEIRIKILSPNGKVYSDIMIDESGNLNWRKSFAISDEDNKDKTGEWKFQISASKATGYFKISLQTY